MADDPVVVRASAVWNGEKIMAVNHVPAPLWNDLAIREQIERALRQTIAEAIASRLDLNIEWRTVPLSCLFDPQFVFPEGSAQ
ncbi:hypothetical protein [Streptomyces sp. KR55]|uniref:hypothetical protein n=1 Tax=Streptomyces sp. KR55 TaxID=3457425 RepID=UPI003FD1C407